MEQFHIKINIERGKDMCYNNQGKREKEVYHLQRKSEKLTLFGKKKRKTYFFENTTNIKIEQKWKILENKQEEGE